MTMLEKVFLRPALPAMLAHDAVSLLVQRARRSRFAPTRSVQ